MRFICTVVAESSVAMAPYSGTAFHRGDEAFMEAWSRTAMSTLLPVELKAHPFIFLSP